MVFILKGIKREAKAYGNLRKLWDAEASASGNEKQVR